MFIILLSYKKPLSEVEAHIAAHRVFLDQGYQNNIFIASGPKVPRTGGVILARLPSRADVEALIQQDPFYQEGIADYEIIEFQSNRFHPDFAAFAT